MDADGKAGGLATKDHERTQKRHSTGKTAIPTLKFFHPKDTKGGGNMRGWKNLAERGTADGGEPEDLATKSAKITKRS
jgi:hypothetical protein